MARPEPSAPASRENRLEGILLLIPALIYDGAYLIVRPALQYVAPALFLGTAAWFFVTAFLRLDKDTSAMSTTFSGVLVALAGLGYGWADAVGREDRDFATVLSIAKELMHSCLALVLATAFKIFLIRVEFIYALPLDGAAVRLALWVLMSILFGQSLLQAVVALMRLNILLYRTTFYLPGMAMVGRHFPDLHQRIVEWWRTKRRRHPTAGSPEPAA